MNANGKAAAVSISARLETLGTPDKDASHKKRNQV